MNKYQQLTNRELDDCTAKWVGLFWEDFSGGPLLVGADDILFGYDWEPTDSHSNQCERYLYPKLRELDEGFAVYVQRLAEGVGCTWNLSESTDTYGLLDVFDLMLQADNRTKVIACLETRDAINLYKERG